MGSVAFAGAVSLGYVAHGFVTPSVPMHDMGVLHVQNKQEMIRYVPSVPACSKPKENCLDTGCCITSGHICFLKYPGVGFCNKTCNPALGYSCGQPPNNRVVAPVAYAPGTNLYCFSVYTNNTGSPKKSWELDLFRTQSKYSLSLFGCNAWDVFSDVTVPIKFDPLRVDTIQVHDVNNEFHVVKRKTTGAWVNWGLFFQVWKKIQEMQKWQQYDYTVKVDADTVFLPQRLQNWLTGKKVTANGIYYSNCKGVQYAFWGAMEVMSQQAVRTYIDNLDECHSAEAQCANTGCDWKFGPWGEDVFAQKCMDRHQVNQVEAFDLVFDGRCPASKPKNEKKNKKWKPSPAECKASYQPALHPFKKPTDWFACYGAITGLNF